MPQQVLRIATYNVRSCVGMDGKRSESRIAEVIASFNADIVALQELDFQRQRSAGVDQAQLIAQQLGCSHLFHPAMTDRHEQYGDAILSRFPLVATRTGELPGPAPWYCRETRAAMWVELQTHLGMVQVINTHFGLARKERLAQADALANEWLATASPDIPLVLLGDFNSLPGSRPYRTLAEKLPDIRTLLPTRAPCRTFPTKFPSLAVDHIFINHLLRPLSLTVFRSDLARVASDHYPLIAELAFTTTS
jgi:endonuclease/exonuclease/phosphatase family metal-dependent hydrolase